MSSKIKVVHFIHGMSTGGAETLVKNYMLTIDKSKFDVVLLCLSHRVESPYEKTLRDNGIKMIFVEDYLCFAGKANFFAKVIKHFQRFLIVRTLIRRENPDILHTHLDVNSFVRFSHPNHSTRIFHTVHSDPNVSWSKNKKGGRSDYRALKWLLKHYNLKFIVLHEEMKKKVDKLFGVTDSIILNNGIMVSEYKKKRDKSKLRYEIGISEEAFVIGHLGRFATVKNHNFLLDVFREIKLGNKEAFLLMVGDGKEKENIVKKIHEYGFDFGDYAILSNRNDVPNLLSTMDVFVFPSLYEGLPLALIEAQEAGLPCFVSDSISEHASISNLVTRISLNDGAKKWANLIVEYSKPQKIILDDENWDMKKNVHKLEEIYVKSIRG